NDDDLNDDDELDDDIYLKIVELSEDGNDFMDNQDYTSAAQAFAEGLMLLPEPKTKWEAYTWLKAGTCDAYFFLNDFQKAQEEAFDAMNGPEGAYNPFILMRLGQCFYELNGSDNEKAIDYLMKSYLLEGEEMFADEDPKYLKAIVPFIQPS
ncbi:MAG: hypothetical protein Q4G54_04290, partial [Pelistega sp.]|nr:hypothetical protein [Pelistega sp.]